MFSYLIVTNLILWIIYKTYSEKRQYGDRIASTKVGLFLRLPSKKKKIFLIFVNRKKYLMYANYDKKDQFQTKNVTLI